MRKFLLFLLFLMTAPKAWCGDIHVSASLDSPQASLEDEITLTVTVEGSQQSSDPILPSLPAFKVVSSGTSSSIQIINGSINSGKEYSYVLIPQNEGTYTIDPITVSVGGKEYKTEPIQIVISKSSALSPPKGANPVPYGFGPFPGAPTAPAEPPPSSSNTGNHDKEARSAWITAEVNNKHPYVNEQILYTFRFYTRARVNEATLTLPDFKDFLSEEVVPEKKYYQEIGGDRFVISEKVMALFPLHPGKTEISETTLQVQILDSSPNSFLNDPFFNFGMGKVSPKNLRADPIFLEVKPLPDSAHPYFTGLVGQFGMTANLSASSLKVGDTATFTLAFSGTGNIQDAVLPHDLVDLPSFKIYADKPAADTVKSENGIQGKKVFKVALVPTSAGDFEIPELSFSYFDPQKGEYQIVKSPSFKIHVEPSGLENLNPVMGGKVPEGKGTAPLIAEDIATLHTSPIVLERESWGKEQNVLLFFGYLLPFLFFVVAALTQSRSRYWKQNEKLYRARRAVKNFKQGIGRLKPEKNEPAIFVSQLLDLLREFIGDHFGVYGKGLTASDMERLLKTHDINRNLVNEIGELTLNLEAGRYGGGVVISHPEAVIKKALKLVLAVDKKLKRK